MAAPRGLGTHEEVPTLYVVFAGFHRDVRRGTGDIVAVSASQAAAREAFRTVRLRLTDRDGWAELTAVSEGGNARRLSWFGVDRWPRPNPLATELRESSPTGRGPRWRRRRPGRHA